MPAMTTITPETARMAAETLGINFTDEAFDLEHGLRSPETNVTGDDPVVTAKIALAHLREMPDYYDKLATIEGD